MNQKEQQENLHAKLFTELERELVPDTFERVKSRLEGKHGLPARDVEQANTPSRLLHLLKRADKIRVGDYTLLKDVLRDVGEANLVRNIEECEREIRSIGDIVKPVTRLQTAYDHTKGELRTLVHDQLLENLARDTTISGEVNEMKSMSRTATDWLVSNGCMYHAEDMTSPKELFEQLERWNVIQIGKYDKLKRLFIMIDRKDKVRIIEEAEDELKALDIGGQTHRKRAPTVDGSKNIGMNLGGEPSAKVPAVESSRNPSLEYQIGKTEEGKSGLLVIFNMFTKQREGTLNDSTNLKTLFETKFNFDVRVRKNLPKAAVVREMASIRHDIEEDKYPQLFLVMLSHGDKEGIYTCCKPGDDFDKCKDEQITMAEILDNFTCEKSKQLIGMPKVFLIQACRGNDYQESAMPDKPGQQEEKADIDTALTKLYTPVDSDFLVAYSQTEGYVSFRNAEKGSWFIQTICDVFEQNYRYHHVLDMLTMVNREVSKKRTKTDLGKNVGQISCQVSTLRSNLFLG
ncbi:caspase-8-like isoform X1 [Lineus longissimus]|uniref:caspase-8-like isoform X1 n=1 Tax=Lineus longissimus TaxID=88925 RepID=UPI00315D8C7A